MRDPLTPVQARLDADDPRDVEAFVARIADDATLADLGALQASTTRRAVVDPERITGRPGSAEAVTMPAADEAEDGPIRRAHVVRES